ncbi:MAG: hypothetical protein WDA09_06345, partial [Bacteriovoracaceae bacterium]
KQIEIMKVLGLDPKQLGIEEATEECPPCPGEGTAPASKGPVTKNKINKKKDKKAKAPKEPKPPKEPRVTRATVFAELIYERKPMTREEIVQEMSKRFKAGAGSDRQSKLSVDRYIRVLEAMKMFDINGEKLTLKNF